jgi:hypothetical protein
VPTKYDQAHQFAMQSSPFVNGCSVQTVKQQVADLRKHADKMEQQERDRRKAQKRAAKQAKQAQQRRAFAVAQLERLAKGEGQAAVEACRELLYNAVGDC